MRKTKDVESDAVCPLKVEEPRYRGHSGGAGGDPSGLESGADHPVAHSVGNGVVVFGHERNAATSSGLGEVIAVAECPWPHPMTMLPRSVLSGVTTAPLNEVDTAAASRGPLLHAVTAASPHAAVTGSEHRATTKMGQRHIRWVLSLVQRCGSAGGHLNTSTYRADRLTDTTATAYCCGPASMTDEVTALVPTARLHVRVITGHAEHLDAIPHTRERDEQNVMYPCVSRSRSSLLTLDL